VQKGNGDAGLVGRAAAEDVEGIAVALDVEKADASVVICDNQMGEALINIKSLRQIACLDLKKHLVLQLDTFL